MISELRRLICPICGSGKLHPCGPASTLARCTACGGIPGEELLGTLRQIVDLPDAVGRHACECGRPEMRRLPDGVFRCPACGSEVLPLEPL